MPKRSWGTGSVYQHKGRWTAAVSLRSVGGKRFRRAMGFSTREEAESALPALRSGIEVLAARRGPREDLVRASLQRAVDRAASDRLPVRGHFVYILWGEDQRWPLYVGETGSLLQRLGHHYRNHGQDIISVQLVECESKEHRRELEQQLIWAYQPSHNRAWGGQRIDWLGVEKRPLRKQMAGQMAGRPEQEVG